MNLLYSNFNTKNTIKKKGSPFINFPILIFLAGLVYTPIFAQQYTHTISEYSVKDGLSSNQVIKIIQDQKDFLWIATKKGLNRFDGHSFEVFFAENTTQHTAYCSDIVEDFKGNIWVSFSKKKGTINPGEYQYFHIIDAHLKTHQIDDYFKGKMPFKSTQIRTIYAMENRHLLLILENNVIYYFNGDFNKIYEGNEHSKFGGFQIDNDDKYHLHSPRHKLTIDSIGQVTYENRFDAKNPKFGSKVGKRFFLDQEANYTFLPKVDSFFIDAMPTEEQKQALQKKRNFRLSWNYLDGKLFIQLLSKRDYWYFSQDGIFQPHLSKTFTKLAKEYSFDYELQLKGGQLCFSTNNGFFLLNINSSNFSQIGKASSDASFRGMIELPNSDVWMISDKEGLYQFHDNKLSPLNIAELSYGTCNFQPYLSNQLILGNIGPRLSKYDLTNKQHQNIEAFFGPEQKAAGLAFNSPFVDRRGNLWVGSTKGLFKGSSQLDSVILFHKFNEFEAIQNHNVNHFQEFDDGIWIGTSDGLYVLDAEEGMTAHYEPLPDLAIYHFYRDGDIFWIPTYGDGLIKWNKTTNEVKKYGLADGFLNENMTAIYPDSLDNLWIATEYGLAKFHKATESISIYLEADGISHNEFNRYSHLKTKDGRIFFGGINGVTIFKPEEVVQNIKPITNLKISQVKALIDKTGVFESQTTHFLKEKKLELTPEIRRLQIDISLLNYSQDHNNRYYYKLENYHTNWQILKENSISLSALPYGNYQLKIKAEDYYGRSNMQELTVPLFVDVLFYKKIKWQIFGISLLMLFGLLIYKNRVRQIKKQKNELAVIIQNRTKTINEQNEKLKSLNQTKDRLFAILAHDLRNPVISFQYMADSVSHLLEHNETERVLTVTKFVKKEANRVHYLLNNLLHWALIQRNEVNVVLTDLNLRDLVKDVFESNQHIADSTNIELLNLVPENLMVFADEQVLRTIFRNLISNSFKFIKLYGEVKIQATENVKEVVIEIKDNGAGMNKSELNVLFNGDLLKPDNQNSGKISFGLHLCQELIQLMDGSISASSESGIGTTFILILPKAKPLTTS